MYAYVNNNTNDDGDDVDDHAENGKGGVRTNNPLMVTTKGGGSNNTQHHRYNRQQQQQQQHHHHDATADLIDYDDDGEARPKLSIQQGSSSGSRSHPKKARASSTASSNWSVETNEEYDRILKELAADAGSSDDDSDSDNEHDEEEGGDDDESVSDTEEAGQNQNAAEQQQQPMGGNRVDHPIQLMSRQNDKIHPQQQSTRGGVGGGISNISSSPTINNSKKQSSKKSSSIIHDEAGEEDVDDESEIILDGNSGIRNARKSTARLQLNRRKSLTQLLTNLAGKAQTMRESITDPHAKDSATAAVEAMEKMAAVASTSSTVNNNISSSASSSLPITSNHAHEYQPPTVLLEKDPSSQYILEQTERPIHRKASVDSNCYYLPTKAKDGNKQSSSSSSSSSWKQRIPTLIRPTTTTTATTTARKGGGNRRSTVESESMWTRYSSGSRSGSSSTDKSYWLQNLHKRNDDGDDNEHGGRHDERGGGFNESQLTLDCDIINQHHAIDEESLQDVLNDIIRGRRRRSRQEGTGDEDKEDGKEEEDDDESPFHFERTENQFYRPGQDTVRKCIGMLFVVAVIIVSAALIGISVQNKKQTLQQQQQQQFSSNGLALLTTTGNTTLDEAISTILDSSTPPSQYTKSDLYYMAKSVNDNCQADQFSTAAGRWECQHICHAHYCCFDLEEDEDGAYNCRTDVNKLCPIFSGCEILVSHDFVGSYSSLVGGGTGLVDEEENISQQQEDGGVSGESSTATSGTMSSNNAQEVLEENELGWQEVRRKYINTHCDESNLATDTGREQCEKACEHHYCCFDTNTGGSGICNNDPSMTCHVYSACQFLSAGDDMSASGSVATTTIPITTAIPIPPDMLGEVVLPDESDEPKEYTADELLQLQADVKERCSDTQTPTGRFHCENICQFHFCCFDTSTDGCYDDPANLCDVYDVCKVLLQPLSSSLENNEEESKTPQMALISEEEEYDEMQSYAPAQSVVVIHDSYAPAQSVMVVHDTYAPAQSAIVVHDTLMPAPIPVPVPTPAPALIPISPFLTLPPVLITAITSTTGINIHNDKPPPRPPIRCVPDGDDEINIEVFSDDWNDDRFDRCARWESKYNMTVTEYWDEYGTSQLT